MTANNSFDVYAANLTAFSLQLQGNQVNSAVWAPVNIGALPKPQSCGAT
jgi:hypothetical protein